MDVPIFKLPTFSRIRPVNGILQYQLLSIRGKSEDRFGRTNHCWAQKLPQDDNPGEKFLADSDEEGEEEAQTKRIAKTKSFERIPELQFLDRSTPYFSSFVKAHALKHNGKSNPENMDIADALTNALQTALEEGLPQLQEEAQSYLDIAAKRTGRIPPQINSGEYVRFSISRMKGDHWETQAHVNSNSWTLMDYGGKLPWSHVSKEFWGDLNSPDVEKNQCLIIHLAAGVHIYETMEEKKEITGGEFPHISLIASEIRSDMYHQAKTCRDPLGELCKETPLIRAELRAHSHDTCKRNHDKDNRILSCSPPTILKGFDVCIINVSPSLRYTIHLYTWGNESHKPWVFLLSYRNHMRLAIPPNIDAQTDYSRGQLRFRFQKGGRIFCPNPETRLQ